MEILQLRYFCSAAENENFSATAKMFKVPPSDISQSIKRLEKELGVTLFDRSANRIRINERGREFHRNISSALDIIDSAVSKATGQEDSKTIRICIKTNRRISMRAVEEFRIQFPETDIIVRHSDSEVEDFDFIISDGAFAEEGFETTEILYEQVLLAMKKGHPLEKEEEIDGRMLKNEPFISMNVGTSLHALTCRACADMGFQPHIAIQSDDPFYIRRCVELGLAIAVVPSISWRGQFSDDIVLRKIPDLERVTCLGRNKKTPLTDNIKRFAEIVTEQFNKEMQ